MKESTKRLKLLNDWSVDEWIESVGALNGKKRKLSLKVARDKRHASLKSFIGNWLWITLTFIGQSVAIVGTTPQIKVANYRDLLGTMARGVLLFSRTNGDATPVGVPRCGRINSASRRMRTRSRAVTYGVNRPTDCKRDPDCLRASRSVRNFM